MDAVKDIDVKEMAEEDPVIAALVQEVQLNNKFIII
jgi:hypothetical protein